MSTAEKTAVKTEINQLQNDIKELEQERDYLMALSAKRNKVAQLKECYARKYESMGSYQFRIGNYDLEKIKKLPDYESRWKNSYYERHQVECENINDGILEKEDMEESLQIAEHSPFRTTEPEKYFIPLTTVCVLEGIVHTPSGPMLTLSDCYGSVTTEPVDEALLPEDYENKTGHMFTISIKYNKYHKYVILEKIMEMPYTLYEDLVI